MPNKINNPSSNISHWLVIFSLVFAGEMIFSLPFHVARFFPDDVSNLSDIDRTTALKSVIWIYVILTISYKLFSTFNF